MGRRICRAANGGFRRVGHDSGGSAMLVLTRRSQEAVMVGARNSSERFLKVTVLDIRGGRVKLGFEVDPEIPVHRWEVWERILTNGRPAADL